MKQMMNKWEIYENTIYHRRKGEFHPVSSTYFLFFITPKAIINELRKYSRQPCQFFRWLGLIVNTLFRFFRTHSRLGPFEIHLKYF